MARRTGGGADTIRSRVYGSSTHDLAADFLNSKLESYGLSSHLQVYTSPALNLSGTNVLAEQRGVCGHSGKYILCAHYDAISDSGTFALAPGADDNASGCAVVLEVARLLSSYRIANTVVYALWDAEEVGPSGSNYYAKAAAARGDTILGVVNLDMLGWDGNNDGLMEVHSSVVGHSNQLADTVARVSQLYQLELNPIVHVPGTGSSDHAAFGRQGYSAILCTEAYWGGDFNPYYHSAEDRLANFNYSFFHNLAKLAAASIAQLAEVEGSVDVRPANLVSEVFALEQNYPNPFNSSTTIKFELPNSSNVKLSVYDLLGREVSTLVNERKDAGLHEVKFDASGLPTGVYFYKLQAGAFMRTRKLLLMK